MQVTLSTNPSGWTEDHDKYLWEGIKAFEEGKAADEANPYVPGGLLFKLFQDGYLLALEAVIEAESLGDWEPSEDESAWKAADDKLLGRRA